MRQDRPTQPFRDVPSRAGRDDDDQLRGWRRPRTPANLKDDQGLRNVRETCATYAADMEKQQEFVLRSIEERDIRFIRLWFTDVLGFLKSVAVAPAELEGAFAEGIGFDGSAIEGLPRGYEADNLVQPPPRTFPLVPGPRDQQG